MKVLHFEATYLNRAGATCHQPNLYADTFRAARLSLEIFGATDIVLRVLGEVELHESATYASVPDGFGNIMYADIDKALQGTGAIGRCRAYTRERP